MKTNYSIDELVREKLANGEEPHNLGAWANMERMLDGKNPYDEPNDQPKGRKRLLSLLLLLLVSTVAVSSYFIFGKQENKTVATNQPSNLRPSQSQLKNVENNNQNSHSQTEKMYTQNEVQTNSTERPITNRSISKPIPLASYTEKTNYDKVKNQKKSKIQTATNSPSIQSNSSIATTTNPNEEGKSTTKLDKSNNQDANSTVNMNSNLSSPINKENDNSSKSIATTENKIDNKVNNEIEKNKNKLAQTATTEYEDKIVPIIHKKVNTSRDENGRLITTIDSFVSQTRIKVPVEKTNPRYVKLDAEDEKRASKVTEPTIAQTAKDLPTLEKPTLVQSTPNNNGLVANNEGLVTKKESFYSKFKKMYKPFLQKVSSTTLNIADKQIPIYPGMIMGVNASLFNTNHNFGGFQTGLTALTPINRYLSLSAEARLMHKNNSGYTVNDYSYTIKTMTEDDVTFTNSKIYTYQIDSNALGYNFKNFYTMQFPILLNAHVKDLTFYGGMHLEYGFRMDVRTSNQDYVVNIADTISNTASYTQRSNITRKYSADDFKSRFGLGYTVGTSYSFNPNIYVDLRMSNVIWDNTKTATKKEISRDFFKVPAIQFSLGYRFRQFDRD